MELWFSDYHTEKVKVSVKVQKQLFGLQTEFQRIDVFDSDEFGRFLSADGSIVFSEKDEFIYDEMIVHVPMAVHPADQYPADFISEAVDQTRASNSASYATFS